MAITTVPAPPLRSQGKTQAQYSSEFEAFAIALPLMATDFNAAATVAQLTTTTTSSSSVLIGTGAKTFTVPSGLGFVIGMTLRIANSSTNYMTADVTSYATTSLVVNVTAVVGAGTFASWAISLSAVGANTAGSVSATPAGNLSGTTAQAQLYELDTEKLSSAAGAVTGANLEDIIASSTVGTIANIPVITYDANGRITAVTQSEKITLATPIATTAGTAHDFISIPSNVKRITFMFNGVSTNGTSPYLIQLGDSGGIENTGYVGGSMRSDNTGNAFATSTAGFLINQNLATTILNGSVVIILQNTDTWIAVGNLSSAFNFITSGSKTLSATLDRVRLTTVIGTDTFDAGSISILYE